MLRMLLWYAVGDLWRFYKAGFCVSLFEHVWNFLAESKMVHFSPFSTFFQSRSPGYAPSKRQKLTKNDPIFAFGRKFQTCSYFLIYV
jgi:hypothetical protein